MFDFFICLQFLPSCGMLNKMENMRRSSASIRRKEDEKIDLIALDLDGTALNPQNQVSPATADAVRRARESGIHVVVSTGRICGEARDFALMLGTDDQMVTSGGATLSSVSQERCTMRMSMPWEAAVRASAVVERIGMITMVYVGETLLITPYDDIEFGKYKSNEGYLSAKKVVPSVAEYIATNHISVDKMFIRSQDPVMLVRARAQLEQIPGIRVMSSATDNLEVITPGRGQGRCSWHAVPRAGHRPRPRRGHRRQRKRPRNAERRSPPDCDGKRKRSR